LGRRPFQSPINWNRPFTYPENEGGSTITAADRPEQGQGAMSGKMAGKCHGNLTEGCGFLMSDDLIVFFIFTKSYGFVGDRKTSGTGNKNCLLAVGLVW